MAETGVLNRINVIYIFYTLLRVVYNHRTKIFTVYTLAKLVKDKGLNNLVSEKFKLPAAATKFIQDDHYENPYKTGNSRGCHGSQSKFINHNFNGLLRPALI